MYRKDSPATIQSMFNSIAKRYDLTNAVLSFSLHRYWNRTLVKYVKQTSSSPVLLDLCSGTGDIAFAYLKQVSSPCQAYLIDFSSEMLEHAKQKANVLNLPSSQPISFIEADVQQIPLPDQIANCATMAYGIRNVQDPKLCIQEVSRLLKPGSCFGILELTRPNIRLLRWGHQFYLRRVLPFLGKRLTDNEQAYQYLCRSIQSFVAPEDIQKLLVENGFENSKILPLAGGIATIILGYKS